VTTPAEKLSDAIERADAQLVRAEQGARDFVVFCDGVEEAGHRVYAQRGRVVADDLLRTAADLRAERSARQSLQEERDRLREMIAAGKLRIPEEWTQ
jgi:hypothetical protein